MAPNKSETLLHIVLLSVFNANTYQLREYSKSKLQQFIVMWQQDLSQMSVHLESKNR